MTCFLQHYYCLLALPTCVLATLVVALVGSEKKERKQQASQPKI